MQQALSTVKDDLWKRLKPYFDQHAKGQLEIDNGKIEELIRDIFRDASQQDVDYVIKNMHRLDVDGSGKVSFAQFANFLFKKHCGEMSLQKRHLKGLMVKGKELKMNKAEFILLLNEAVKFLKVTVSDDVCNEIFTTTDKDKDGEISYVEYFKAIDMFICKDKKEIENDSQKEISENKPREIVPEPEPKPEPQIILTVRQSRLRIFIWNELHRLYERYVLGRSLGFNELRGLLISIISDLTQLEITFILTGLYQMKGNFITFVEFATRFLYLIAQIFVGRYHQNHSVQIRKLTWEQFHVLFLNNWKFLSIHSINIQFIKLIYFNIKGTRTFILYEDYLNWVLTFLSAENWYGGIYYFPEDDPELSKFDNLFLNPKPQPRPKPQPNQRLVFSNHDLAYAVRKRTWDLLVKYDVNLDQLFSQEQIQNALIDLLKEDKNQLHYVTKNVFRYDRDGDNNITYDEFTNFAVEQHFGEMAIQRLHRKSFYARGAERIMNKQQFWKTINFSLNFIQMEVTKQQIDLLFSEVDLDQDGWISYQLYFLFLRYYFGSLSVAYLKPKVEQKKPLSFKTILLQSLKGLSNYDRLLRLLMEQLRFLFLQYDQNKNLSFEPNQIQNILSHIFQFNDNEIKLIMFEIFRVDATYSKTISFEDLVAIILNIYFIHILLRRKFENIGRTNWKLRKINYQQFRMLFTDGCYFITILPFEEDLQFIFQDLDTDKDGFITLQEYIVFIRKYIGRDKAIHDEPPAIESPKKTKQIQVPKGIEQEQYGFVENIWGELKRLFDRYDQGAKGYVTEAQFKTFAIEVLNEKSDNDLKYIFWNLFRLDSDFDKKIQFEEFAPYVLKHAGQIALQRFHITQTKGKNTLNENELFIVISNAYSFLSTMPKSKPIIAKIYSRIAKQDGVTYGAYLGWVGIAIAKRYR